MMISRYTSLSKKRAYALSGGLGLFLISVGIPFLAGGIYGLTGARSVIGKITFTLIGFPFYIISLYGIDNNLNMDDESINHEQN